MATDIDNLAAEYSLQKPEPAADGPGNNYAKYGTCILRRCLKQSLRCSYAISTTLTLRTQLAAV